MKTALSRALVLVVLPLMALACSSREPRSMSAAAMLATPNPQAITPPGGPAVADRAMRITVETTVVVPHRDAAVSALRSSVASFGGYVGEGTVTGGDVGGSASFTVKIPVAGLADFRGKLASLGEVTRESEKAEDVTEARADIKARLRNARAEDGRLLDLLANRTGNLGDVVAVEKELASVRETIERFEAEERTLEGQIAFATVKIELTTVWVPPPESPWQKLVASAKEGLVNAKDVVFGVVTLGLVAGPTLLMFAAAGYAFYWVINRWAKKRKAPAA
jgi:hypothetical protein